MTTALLNDRIADLAMVSLVEFSGHATPDHAEWIRRMLPLICSFAVACSVTDPDRDACLKEIRKQGGLLAHNLGLTHGGASFDQAGLMAVLIALAAAAMVEL